MLLGTIEEMEAREAAAVLWPNTGSNVKIAKPQTFNRKASKISKFLIAYKLYIRIKMREIVVKEQI